MLRRFLIRHLGLWLALIGGLLLLGADLTVSDLRGQAQDRRAAQIAFLQLAEDSHRLNRLVLESLARGRADDRVFAAVEANSRAIDAQLGRQAVTRDGSLLVTEDGNGTMWRIVSHGTGGPSR